MIGKEFYKNFVKMENLKNVDLKSEYELIKQKKSRLSAALRNLVVDMVENPDKYVKPEPTGKESV
jgi:hypothetical protein